MAEVDTGSDTLSEPVVEAMPLAQVAPIQDIIHIERMKGAKR